MELRGDGLYLYEIGNEYGTTDILCHHRQFAPDEFYDMCNEIPKRVINWEDGGYSEYYKWDEVKESLIKKYQFDEVEIQASVVFHY